MARFKVGQTVKHSAYAMRPLWDRYLGEGGPRKAAYRAMHDGVAAHRGTVLSADETSADVAWDDGTQTQSLDYMLDLAEPAK